MWIDLALTDYEMQGVSGEIHTFAGCSLVGLFQFHAALADLQSMLSEAHPDLPAAVLYQCDKRFRFLVDKALRLNGIQPEWVNWAIAEQLLFSPGILLDLNQPKASTKPSEGSATTLPEMLAALATVTGIPEAIALAKTEPFQPLLDILDAMREQAKTPEERARSDFADWVKQEKAKAAAA